MRYKFRGKDIITGEWIFGGHYTWGDTHYITVEGKGTLEHLRVLPESVGQWTGRVLNGVYVYDGDLVDVTGYMDDYEISIEVFWDNEELRWGYRKHDVDETEEGELWAIIDKNSTVIGSIHDTPELLSK